MDTKLVDTRNAADHIGLAESTLEKLRVSGNGPRFAKLGRAVRYRVCDLDRWTEERLIGSTSEAGAG